MTFKSSFEIAFGVSKYKTIKSQFRCLEKLKNK